MDGWAKQHDRVLVVYSPAAYKRYTSSKASHLRRLLILRAGAKHLTSTGLMERRYATIRKAV